MTMISLILKLSDFIICPLGVGSILIFHDGLIFYYSTKNFYDRDTFPLSQMLIQTAKAWVLDSFMPHRLNPISHVRSLCHRRRGCDGNTIGLGTRLYPNSIKSNQPRKF